MLFVNQLNTLQNQRIIETMTMEYSIISLSSQFVDTYNTVLKNPKDPNYIKEYQKLHTEIPQVIATIEKNIISQESKILLVGVKNTVNHMMDECDEGIKEVNNGNYESIYARFTQANAGSEFVSQNVQVLLQKELEYLSKTQKQSQQSYFISTLLSISLFLVITLIMIILANRFTKQLVAPITKLSQLAEDIAKGNLQENIENIMLVKKDEIGSLSRSFSIMLKKLREDVDFEKRAKQEIEQKVIERTKELHDEQRKLEASINSLSVGFIMVDLENKIVTINQTAKMHLCASPTSPLATITECTLIHIEDELKGAIDLRSHISTCLSEKKPITIPEVIFQNKSLKILISPIIALGVIGAVVLIEDITEGKILERSKDEFFSIASHELRTPLTAIRGNTSMIKQYYGEKITDPELNEMIQDIHASSIRLIEIVNDFLDLSRLEQRKMEFNKETVNIPDLINSVLKEYQVTGSQNKIALIFDPPKDNVPFPQAYTDLNKTKQVLINLIGNALKFTEKGSITITTAIDGGFIKILITDTGRGISLTNQNLLFHKFQQAGTSLLTRDTTKGTGLGLYISKLMTEGLGGTIKLEKSIEGYGSTFSFSLPIVTPEQLQKHSSVENTTKIDAATGLTQKG